MFQATGGVAPDMAGGLVGTVGATELFPCARDDGDVPCSSACWRRKSGLVVAFDDWLGWLVGWMKSTGMPVAADLERAEGRCGVRGGAWRRRRGPRRSRRRRAGPAGRAARDVQRHRKPVAVRLNDLDDDEPSVEKGVRRRGSGARGRAGRRATGRGRPEEELAKTELGRRVRRKERTATASRTRRARMLWARRKGTRHEGRDHGGRRARTRTSRCRRVDRDR